MPPSQVLLETERTLTAEEADEIKAAWRAWQEVARRYGIQVRPQERTLILPDHDVKQRETI